MLGFLLVVNHEDVMVETGRRKVPLETTVRKLLKLLIDVAVRILGHERDLIAKRVPIREIVRVIDRSIVSLIHNAWVPHLGILRRLEVHFIAVAQSYC